MSTPADGKLSVAALTALVVGSMVGAGIFSLPATFGRASGGFGAIIAWMIAGGGMLMLAFVFQSLAQRKPELDSGIYAYASAGFGNYLGFASAFGFWAGTCIGNVSYFILIKSTLGAFFPVFGDGNTITAILASSVLLWAFHFLVLRGVQEAAVINTIATVAKMIPILVFIIVVAVAFDRDLFALNFLGNAALSQAADLAHLDDYGRVGHAAAELVAAPQESLFDQVRSTMLVTVFVFLGIEGASVYSRYARSPRDVGIATVLGFVGVLCLLILITLLSYGVLLRPELAALRQPSMAGVLELIVGRWGAIFISIGLIVSVLGAFLSWTLLACEVLHAAAGDKAMPAVLARENRHGVPSAALWLTTGFVQVFLGLTFFTEAAFTLALELTSSLTLIPYLLVAAYAVKLARSGETYENGVGRRKDLLIALIATGYAVLMVFAGGLKYLLLSALIYAPGTVLYFKARREQGVVTFNAAERLVFGVAVLGAGVALAGMVSGWIELWSMLASCRARATDVKSASEQQGYGRPRMNESPFLQYKDVLVHDRRASARCLRSIVLSMRECSDCSVNADDLAQLTPEHFEAAQALLAVYKDGLANDRAAMEVLREVEKHWPDYRTAPYGLDPFPDPEMIFVPDQAELIEHLQPFFGIDLSTVNREWTGYLTMLGPLEPTEHESVGQATEGTPWHNRLVHTNWIGFKVENGRYRLMGDPRYFFLHAGNEHLADPYVEAREQLVEHYARQKTAYEAARAQYRETGLLFCPSDLAEGVPAHRVEQMAFVEQIGGVADFSKFPASSLTLGYEECGKSGITAGYPCSPAGRVFHHVASVPGYHYQSTGADRVMMFYEPVEGLVLFGFYREGHYS